MSSVRALLLFLLSGFLGSYAADSRSVSVIGTNEHLSNGAQALLMGNHHEGVRLTRKGLSMATSRAHRSTALNNLCAGLVGIEEFDEAIEICDEALTVNEKNWRIYNNRALAYLGKGDIEKARRDVEAGLALSPESVKLARVQAMITARDVQPTVTISN